MFYIGITQLIYIEMRILFMHNFQKEIISCLKTCNPLLIIIYNVIHFIRNQLQNYMLIELDEKLEFYQCR